MATSGRGTITASYNVQTAVDDKHHLIITHEVTNVDRGQLSSMANLARIEIEAESLTGLVQVTNSVTPAAKYLLSM